MQIDPGEAVVELTIQAASRDPRFPPVSTIELPRLHLELSLLGRPRAARPEEVVVGRHGIIISAEGRRGLLLPQVAKEHGWDALTFLAHGCRKAGLAPEAWRNGAGIELFEASVFGE